MDAHVTLTGNVGGDVEYRKTTLSVASFRLATTPRFRKAGEWVDGATTWLTVTCFRSLAEHVASSVRRGDPVVVAGRLRTNVWKTEGVERERLVLEASSVGHDLTWGTSAFRRVNRAMVPPDREADVGELISSVENQAYAAAPDDRDPSEPGDPDESHEGGVPDQTVAA